MTMTVKMQARIFARSLLLQACWSFERMQGVGLSYCLEPWLEEVWGGDPEALRAAKVRHQAFFNTQPYVAGIVIGMICGLEEEAAGALPEERAAKLERLQALKTAASAALAGIGDAFFWGALRPFCAALALCLALSLRHLHPAAAVLWAAGAYLIVHNTAALTLRWRGLRLGYEWKGAIAARLKELPAQAAIRRVRFAAFALAVGATAIMAAAFSPSAATRGLLALAAFAGLRLLPLRMTTHGIYAATCALGVVIAAATAWSS